MLENAQPPKTALAVPFTREELRQDILNIYLHQLRTTGLIADDERVWALTGKPRHHSFGLMSLGEPGDYGLRYEDAAQCELAKALEQQYDYGFFGMESVGREEMAYETIHTWVAAYLIDLKASQMVQETESYVGMGLAQSAGRCLHACELANARRVLEGEAPFSYFSGFADRGEHEPTAFEALTIRQMALLSGMEEMTIRTAASRKSAFPLETYKDDRRTLVSAEVAKAWLQAKGRYVPITRQWYGNELDLARMKFTSVHALGCALDERIRQLELRAPAPGDVRRQVAAAFGAEGYAVYFLRDRHSLREADRIGDLARMLALPPELLILRARETALHDELALTESEVRQATLSPCPHHVQGDPS